MSNNRTLPFDIPGKDASGDEKTIPDKLYFRISEVSKLTGLEPYVLRYWETEFKFIKPVRTKSRHRLYRRRDLNVIFEIKRLLYAEQYTIAGAKKKLEELLREDRKEEREEAVETINPKTTLLTSIEELKAIRKLLS